MSSWVYGFDASWREWVSPRQGHVGSLSSSAIIASAKVYSIFRTYSFDAHSRVPRYLPESSAISRVERLPRVPLPERHAGVAIVIERRQSLRDRQSLRGNADAAVVFQFHGCLPLVQFPSAWSYA